MGVLFLTTSLSIVAAVAAIAALLWLFLTPEGKAVLAKGKAAENAKKAAENAKKARILQVKDNLALASKLSDLDERKVQKITQALRELEETRTYWIDRKLLMIPIHQEIRKVAPLVISKVSPATGLHDIVFDCLFGLPSQDLYNLALKALEAHPREPRAKQNALKIGRYHCGRSRKDGNVTIYDEQAIQNDIQVRSK